MFTIHFGGYIPLFLEKPHVVIRGHVLMRFFSGQMLFLDEPSAAVDAGAKRHLWKVIKARAPDQYPVMKTNLNHESYVISSLKLTYTP